MGVVYFNAIAGHTSTIEDDWGTGAGMSGMEQLLKTVQTKRRWSLQLCYSNPMEVIRECCEI